MKTVFVTLVGGLSIMLLASAGIKNDEASVKEQHIEVNRELINQGFQLPFFSPNLEGLRHDKIIKIEDITVCEFEEEVNLGFDTEDYLPENFNPYEGLNTYKISDFEEKRLFQAIFGNIPEYEIVEVEDILLYEIEDTI